MIAYLGYLLIVGSVLVMLCGVVFATAIIIGGEPIRYKDEE